MTTTTTENRHAVVTGNLVKLYGTSTAAPVNAPMGTASAKRLDHNKPCLNLKEVCSAI